MRGKVSNQALQRNISKRLRCRFYFYVTAFSETDSGRRAREHMVPAPKPPTKPPNDPRVSKQPTISLPRPIQLSSPPAELVMGTTYSAVVQVVATQS